jgi:hypothetical protein
MAMVRAAFHEAPEVLQEEPDYHPMSGLAVAGLILGLVSAAAFLSTVAWALAGVAVLVNMIALVQVARSDPPRMGRRAAQVGLVISLFCLAGAITVHLSQSWLCRAHARSVVELWLTKVLEGDMEIADQLTLLPQNRLGGLESLRQEYQEQPFLRDRLEAYKKADAMKQLMDAAGRASFSLVDVVEQISDAVQEVVVFRYRIDVQRADRLESFEVTIGATRPEGSSKAVSTWRVQAPGGGADAQPRTFDMPAPPEA